MSKNYDYKIYTDGACSNNGRSAALASWSYVVTDLHNNVIEARTGKLQGIQDSNRAELTAFIKVMQHIKNDRDKNTYIIYTDFEALYKFCHGENNPRTNLDLYKEIRILLNLCKDRVIVEKVKAHKTKDGIVNFINGLVDKLARKSLTFYDNNHKHRGLATG